MNNLTQRLHRVGVTGAQILNKTNPYIFHLER